MAPGYRDNDKTLLERHWPLMLSVLVLIVLCFAYFAIYSEKSSTARSLLLAIVPDVAASLLIAACLYLLLNRDFRAARSETVHYDDLRSEMEEQLGALRSAIQALSDHSGALRKRSTIPPLDSMFADANVISIAAVSGLGFVNHHRGLLEDQLRKGRKLRVLLLDIDRRDALQSWDRLSNPPMNTPEEDIRAGIRQFLGLADLREYPGSCEVKLLDTCLPYSLILCEGAHVSEMQVEMHAYRRAPEERPNILLSSQADQHWFEFFAQQFDLAWSKARVPPR